MVKDKFIITMCYACTVNRGWTGMRYTAVLHYSVLSEDYKQA